MSEAETNPYAPPEADRVENNASEVRLEELGTAEAVMKEQIRIHTALRVFAKTFSQLGWASGAVTLIIAFFATRNQAIGVLSLIPGLIFPPLLLIAGYGLQRFRSWSRVFTLAMIWVAWIMLAFEGALGIWLIMALDPRLIGPVAVDNAVGIAVICGGIVLASGPLVLVDRLAGKRPFAITRAGKALVPLVIFLLTTGTVAMGNFPWATQAVLTGGASITAVMALPLYGFFSQFATQQAFSPEERARIGRLAAYETVEALREARQRSLSN